MTPRSIFKLKVWHQEGDEFCSFLLLWDGGSKDIYVSLKYSEELQKRYRRWQKLYLAFYELRPPQPLGNSGALNPGFGDRGNVLQEAEQDLIKSFQRWLGEGEVRKIQEKIRDELSHIAQHSSEQGREVGERVGIDVFISCNSIELARLPWEAWELAPERAPLGTVRIARTFAHSPELCPIKRPLPYRRPQLLALIGSDPELPLHEDWKTLRSSLKSIADIYRVQWLPDDGIVEIKNKIAADISDKRGWDVLFFAGHSDETSNDGRLSIASNLSLSIGELEDYLIEARENGLQLAVFNSCSGLPIATKLVELGMQVVVMREPIPHKAAQIFLKQFCQQLAEHRDAHDALQHACYHLQSVEKFAYPSAYLIPSFFSPANAVPFRIEPSGWRRCTPRGLVLATLLLLSLMTPVQDWLLDRRVLVQAMYRNATNQLPRETLPPVRLIAIDRESIDRAAETMDGFQVKPMDRRYLANLVTQLSTLGVKVIGIDYFLDRPEANSEQLAKSIQAAVKQQQTWFVLATSEPDGWKVTPAIASPNWSLQGDVNSEGWDVELPKEPTCSEICPFAYLLALAHTLNGNSSLVDPPQPQLQSHTDFQQALSQYLNRGEEQQNAIAFLQRTYSPPGLRSILDFSIPPQQTYDRMSAWQFLNRPLPDPKFQEQLQQQVVIIATGRYSKAEDNFPMPPAIYYWKPWCHSSHHRERQKLGCVDIFTGGETHAYTVSQLLSSHRIVLIHDFWTMGVAAILGKWVTQRLRQQQNSKREQQVFKLVGATSIYGLVGLQVYISASVLIPWFLPSVIFWTYILSIFRKKY